MLKLEFDPANKPLAAAFGAALTAYGIGAEFTAELTTTASNGMCFANKGDSEENMAADIAEETAGNSSETPDKSASVAGATDTSTTTETATSAGATGPAAGHPETDWNNLDEKGVGKNPNFCSNAQIPFNQSGKKKGQWKKKQGVDETLYDEWYASELAIVNASGGASTPAEETPVDTGAAFGGNQQQAPAAGGLEFDDAGQFMAWVSEQQTANRLTQHDIDSAYQMTATAVQDLFNPATFPDTVKAVYEFLAPIAAGQ